MTHQFVPEDHFPTDQPTIASVCAQAAWREAKMFEERFGAGEGRIVTFESLDRAVAIVVTLADEELLTAELKGPSWRGCDGVPRSGSGEGTWRLCDSHFEQLGKRERRLMMGGLNCVSILHVLRCRSRRIYAIHGIGTEQMTEPLRSDVAAIAARLVSGS